MGINYQPPSTGEFAGFLNHQQQEKNSTNPSDLKVLNEPLNRPETEACTVTGQAAGVACAVSLQQNTVVCLGGRDVFFFFFGVSYLCEVWSYKKKSNSWFDGWIVIF